MNKVLYKLMYFQIAASVGVSFVMLFVNLYIWTKNESFLDLVIFNLSIYAVWPIFYTLGSYLMFKYTLKTTMRMASVFFVFLFSVLAFVPMDNGIFLIIITGVLYSATRSLLANGNTQAIAALGKGKEIIKYYQLTDLWVKTLNIVSPIVFSVALYYFGYKTIFIVMLLFALGIFIHSNFLPHLKISDKFENKRMFDGFNPLKLYKKKHHKKLPLSYLSGGLFSEFQTIFLVFFTFTISSNQIVVGLLNVLYTLLILLSIKMYDRFKIKDTTWLFIGIGFAFPGFVLAMFLENWWMIIPNLLLVFGNFYYRTTFYAHHFQAIDDVDPLPKFQMTIFREWHLVASRIIFLLPIFIMYTVYDLEIDDFIGYVMAIIFVFTLCVPFIHKTFRLPKK